MASAREGRAKTAKRDFAAGRERSERDLGGVEDLSEYVFCFGSSLSGPFMVIFDHDAVPTDGDKQRLNVVR